jgi:ribosome-associated translation inhibitor RaiA
MEMTAGSALLVPTFLKGRRKIWTADHKDFVVDRLAAAIGAFGRRIRRITVWLEDVNGPRGGVDKRCRITLHLKRSGRLTADASAATRYWAIAKATARARTALVRKRERKSSLRGRVRLNETYRQRKEGYG